MLDYAPRRRWGSLASALFVLILLGLGASVLARTHNLLLWLRDYKAWSACTRHVAAADTPCYINCPLASALRTACLRYVPTNGQARRSFIEPAPACWKDIERVRYGNVEKDALLFLGMRSSPAGHARLVAITLWAFDPDDTTFLGTIEQHVLRAPQLGKAPLRQHLLEIVAEGAIFALPKGEDTFAFYEGRADPGNPSRFLIPYEYGSRKGILSGALNDDDTVSLKYESGGMIRGE